MNHDSWLSRSWLMIVNTRESWAEIVNCHDSWADFRMNSLGIMILELLSDFLFESILRWNWFEKNGDELRSYVTWLDYESQKWGHNRSSKVNNYQFMSKIIWKNHDGQFWILKNIILKNPWSLYFWNFDVDNSSERLIFYDPYFMLPT